MITLHDGVKVPVWALMSLFIIDILDGDVNADPASFTFDDAPDYYYLRDTDEYRFRRHGIPSIFD